MPHSHIITLGTRSYIIPANSVVDISWTPAETRWFLWAIAFQQPSTSATMNASIHMARMWIYHRRGCRYPDEWYGQLMQLDDAAKTTV